MKETTHGVSGPPYIYLLTNRSGARALLRGEVPASIQRQAREALNFKLSDLAKRKRGSQR